MIDFSSTVVELSGDSEKQKEVQDIAKCLRTLTAHWYFYPRPPRGGRRHRWCGWTGWTVMCCMAL